jgi:hypothetical protein
MRITLASGPALAAILCLCTPSSSSAQIFEVVGTRAQGMGGAFVAVADDANANWWNPAGLATGALFSTAIERAGLTEPASVPSRGPASETRTAGVAFAFPSLGLGYYRLRVGDIRPPTGVPGVDREDQGATGVVRRTVSISEYSAIVGQSITDHLVVATRLKLVRAGSTETVSADASGENALEAARDADVSRETSGAFDVGVMVTVPHVRIGLTIKNVNEPEFGDGSDQLRLERQARVGLAFLAARFGPVENIIASVDADLTRTATVVGEVRHVAAGAEGWLLGRRVGVRGGVNANTTGEANVTGSGGLSLGLRAGFYFDAALTFGPDLTRKGWATALRAAF